MRRWVSLLGLTALVLVPAGHTQVQPSASYSVQGVSHGLKLTLAIPKNVYPRYALIRARIDMQNISRRVVYLPQWGAPCERLNGFDDPGVEVTDGTGNEVYPPAISGFPEPPCAPLPNRKLRSVQPGRTLTRQVYAILRGSRISAFVSAANTTQPSGSGGTLRVTTPTLNLHLTAGARPHTDVHTVAPDISADIQPTGPVQGLLHYIAWNQCPAGSIATSGQVSAVWAPAPGTHLSPSCSPVQTWAVVAGWLGQPVAEIQYSSSDLPPPPPAPESGREDVGE